AADTQLRLADAAQPLPAAPRKDHRMRQAHLPAPLADRKRAATRMSAVVFFISTRPPRSMTAHYARPWPLQALRGHGWAGLHPLAGQLAGLLHPLGKLRFVELALIYVQIA